MVARPARGHYIDGGGTRLNSPIKPAIDLGAEKVIVVGLEPFAPVAPRPATPAAPSIAVDRRRVAEQEAVDEFRALRRGSEAF